MRFNKRLRKKQISIHALREEGDRDGQTAACVDAISIHALREEGDRASSTATSTCSYFYPRPPRGGRLALGSTLALDNVFLSTPSARRATGSYREGDTNITQFLSTPSARRATRGAERREHRL